MYVTIHIKTYMIMYIVYSLKAQICDNLFPAHSLSQNSLRVVWPVEYHTGAGIGRAEEKDIEEEEEEEMGLEA